ncbi:MAG: ATP-grasp domain-containing protein [Clostridia bacterium]|nr:ATP-grasp domain-containing protein [Clostridia bacterium]
MKVEKYNIKVGRDVIKVKKDGKLSKTSFPSVIAKDNMYIQKQDSNYLIKVESPVEKSVYDVLEKYEGFFNVLAEALYQSGDIIWPSATYKEGIESKVYVTFSFDEEFLEEEGVPLGEAYSKINSIFKENADYIEKLIGKFNYKVSSKKINITLNLDMYNRIGISDDTLKIICALCFISLEAFDKIDKTALKKVDKKYNLKAAEAIDKVFSSGKKSNDSLKVDDEIMVLAEKYMKESHDLRYIVINHSRLAAASKSSLIDALALGIDYKILNESKSIIEFSKGKHKEFLIEGTKTTRDYYIYEIITDDKYVAKKIMKEAGLNVPEAIILYRSMDESDIEERIKPYLNKKIVVKPRNTNFGTGITVFNEKASKEQVMTAIKYAFEFDENILIEQYVKGMEYRFIVINGKCISIVHRRAASVVGDGKSTIKELMREKSKEPWHVQVGSPMKFDPPVEEYLKLQNLTYDSVIPKGKRIFVRKNSNCSSGGEAVDYTNVIPAKFKRIAEKAAKAFNGKICGVDIIIDDMKSDDYSIIEINDNPGYSISEWPYEGDEVKIGVSIFKMLGF